MWGLYRGHFYVGPYVGAEITWAYVGVIDNVGLCGAVINWAYMGGQ